jgi:hypothetical protein
MNIFQVNLIKSDFSIGMRLIDSFSQIVSSKYMFPLCTEFIKKLIVSTNPFERRAGISSIGSLAEGCTEKVKEGLQEIVNTLVNLFLNDQSTLIKTACIVTMDFLTQFCSPEIIEHHHKILPMLLSGLESNIEEVLEKSLIELNYFCQNLDVELDGYINELLPKLIYILENHKSVKVQQECLFALASIIRSAQGLVSNALFPILETCRLIIMNRNTENENELRANSLNCVANISFVVKLEAFKPYLEFFTNFAYECIKSNIYEFQDAGFSYFGAVAKIMGSDFKTYFNNLMEIAMVVLKDDSGINNEDNKDEYGLDSDSEEDEEGGDVFVNEVFIDAKCSVIMAIMNFAHSCPSEFMTHLPNVMKEFETLWDYIHENVNNELILAYEELLYVIAEAETSSTEEIKLYIKAWLHEVLPKYEKIIEESDNKEEVVKVLESIHGIIERFGAELFYKNNTLERIMNHTKSLLDFKALCQVKNDEVDEEEDIDHDEKILGGVVDIYLITSEKLGNEFHESFSGIFTSLKKYLSVSRSEADRSMVFGLFADVFKYCKTSTKFYIGILFQSIEENIKKNMKKKNDELFRHIAYLIGILYESDISVAIEYINASMNILQTIYENSSKMGKDNVIAALCRIICSEALSGDIYVKAIETVFTNIPLTNDTFENITALRFVTHISQKIDIEGFKKYFCQTMNTIKMIVLNEIKCGTTKQILKDVKIYLENLSTNEVIKGMIDAILLSNFNEAERERFVNTMRSA